MRYHQYLPTSVMDRVVAVTPEYHTIPPGVEHLDFYYDTATFRGRDGNSELEVYFGIVPALMSVREQGRRVWMDLERKAVLSTRDGEEVYRTVEEMPIAGTAESFVRLMEKDTKPPCHPCQGVGDRVGVGKGLV